jgi:hypothetical protein
MAILDRLEKGEITPEQAMVMLEGKGLPKASEPDTPMSVLELLERGEISTEEAAQRLSAAKSSESKEQPKSAKPKRVEVIEKRRVLVPDYSWAWWAIPITLGIIFTLLAGFWMRADAADGGLGLSFFCAWVPMLLGLGLILLGWLSRRGPWANLKVHSSSKNVNVDIDTQVPVGVATTALKTFGRRIPGMDQADVDKMTRAFEEIRRSGTPIHVQTNDDDEDNAVDITIG